MMRRRFAFVLTGAFIGLVALFLGVYLRSSNINESAAELASPIPLENSFNPIDTVAEVEAAAGFHVLEPSAMPSNYRFRSASLGGLLKHVRQTYETYGRQLIIMQEPNASEDDIYPFASEDAERIESVMVHDFAGTYFEESGVRMLSWYQDGSILRLQTAGSSPGHAAYLGKDELLIIAESMQ